MEEQRRKRRNLVVTVQLVIVGLAAIAVLTVYFAKDRTKPVQPKFNTQRLMDIGEKYANRITEKQQQAAGSTITDGKNGFQITIPQKFTSYPQLKSNKLLFLARSSYNGGSTVAVLKQSADSTIGDWRAHLDHLLVQSHDLLKNQGDFVIENVVDSSTTPETWTITIDQPSGNMDGMAKIIPGDSTHMAVIAITENWDIASGDVVKIVDSFKLLD